MFSTCAGAVHQVVEDSMQIALPVLKPNPQLRASSSAKEVARNTQTCGPWRLLLASHSISDDLLMRHMGQPLSEQVVGEMMPCMQNNSCNRRAVMTTPSQTNAHLSSGVPSASAGKNSSARPTRGRCSDPEPGSWWPLPRALHSGTPAGWHGAGSVSCGSEKGGRRPVHLKSTGARSEMCTLAETQAPQTAGAFGDFAPGWRPGARHTWVWWEAVARDSDRWIIFPM